MAKQAGAMWGRAALLLGVGALVPLAGVASACGALLAGAACLVLARRRPELRGLRFRGWVALLLAVVGLGLSSAEAWGFLGWKQAQAEVQRRQVTVLRLSAIKDAVERYGALRGTYPEAASASELRAALVPGIVSECPLEDGWGREFQITSGAGGYRIGVRPNPARAPRPTAGGQPSAPSQVRSASTAELTIPPAQPDPSPTR